MGDDSAIGRAYTFRDELIEVTKRGPRERIYHPPKGMKRLDLPLLQALAEAHFPDEWEHDPAGALDLVFRLAIEKLPAERLSLETRMTKREAAYRWLNLAEPRYGVEPLVLEGVTGKSYDYLLDELYRRANLVQASETQRRAPMTGLRLELAEILAHPDFPHQAESEPDSVTLAVLRDELENRYIERPEYEALIRRKRDQGVRHVWIHGDAGTGKTRLAAAANVDRLAEAEVPVLAAAGDDGQLARAVSAFLTSKRGVLAEAINPLNIWALLLSELAADNCPPIVVFDDMPDGDVLDLLLQSAKSLVIFTSTERPPARFRGFSLELLELEDDQAMAMARSRLPGPDDGALRKFIELTGGRPLAIDHSAAFIRETGMTIQAYDDALDNEPATTLVAAGEKYGRTLTAQYALTLERLKTTPEALRVLDLILFTFPNTLSVSDVAEVWSEGQDFEFFSGDQPKPAHISDAEYLDVTGLAYMWPGAIVGEPRKVRFLDAVSRRDLLRGIRLLEKFSLIRGRQDSYAISMHQLTRRILRSLRADHATASHAHLRVEVGKFIDAEMWEGGSALPQWLVAWIVRIDEAIEADRPDFESLLTCSPEDLALSVSLEAALLRATRQIGGSVKSIVNQSNGLVMASLGQLARDALSSSQREALSKSFAVLERELLIEFRVASAMPGFEIDAGLETVFGALPPSFYAAINRARLKYDTEWDLAQHFSDVEASERHLNSVPSGPRTLSDYPQHHQWADNASLLAASYYDQARWNDAIAALEHAYSCYVKVGSNAACTSGAIDAARRLSRVNLRAGNLNDAAVWLMRAQEVHRSRCEISKNGYPVRFALHDGLQDLRVSQAAAELELTRLTLEFDVDDEHEDMTEFTKFCAREAIVADGAVRWLLATSCDRLVPEFTMHEQRLYSLSGKVKSPQPVDVLAAILQKPGFEYQSLLVKVQRLTLVTPLLAMSLDMTDEELAESTAGIEDIHVSGLRSLRENAGAVCDELFNSSHKIGREFENWYWHARGLCAAYMLGVAAGGSTEWRSAILQHIEVATTTINRPDWVQKIEEYPGKSYGIWLLGY